MARLLEEIEAQEKELVAEKKQALKEHKKNAVAEVKRLILKHKLTKGILISMTYSVGTIEWE